MRTNDLHTTTTDPRQVEPDLSDRRIYLRPWRAGDAAQLHAAAGESVASVGRWRPWCHADYLLHEACEWIAHCQHGWQSGSYFALPVFERGSDLLLGAVGINQIDRANRRANLGYWVRQSRQREGIAAAAVAMAARFGFDRLELVRIEILVMPDNLASRRTAEHVGARFEGIARRRLWLDGTPQDAAMYGLIRSDLG